MAECRTIYSARREAAAGEIDTITDFNSNLFPDFCFRDHSGKYEHSNGQCPVNPSHVFDCPVCPFEEWDVCNDQLRWIDTAKFLSCYFRNPAGAHSQQILHGFDKHLFIHYYRYVMSRRVVDCEILKVVTPLETLSCHRIVFGHRIGI